MHMALGIYVLLQVLRKTIGLSLFLFAAFALLLVMVMDFLLSWIATSPTEGMRAYCLEQIRDAWKWLVYDPKPH